MRIQLQRHPRTIFPEGSGPLTAAFVLGDGFFLSTAAKQSGWSMKWLDKELYSHLVAIQLGVYMEVVNTRYESGYLSVLDHHNSFLLASINPVDFNGILL